VEKAFEFFDTWLRSQKDFLENWIGSQKGLMENWIGAIKKIQQAVNTMTGSPGVSQTEEFMKSLLDLYSNPLFKREFPDFFLRIQQEGIETARKFWDTFLFPNISEVFENMFDFYLNLGFVPFTKYERVAKENRQLKKEYNQLKEENQFLKDIIKDLNQQVLTEGGKAMRELWKTSIEKHVEMSREIARGFLDIFKQSSRE